MTALIPRPVGSVTPGYNGTMSPKYTGGGSGDVAIGGAVAAGVLAVLRILLRLSFGELVGSDGLDGFFLDGAMLSMKGWMLVE
jgi:hypothetical protein